MIILLKVFNESIAQAWSQLRANKLRSFLSLLGITIGIFCIIGVQAAVHSLEDNVRGSIEKLGDDVLYVQKMPWDEDPGQNFWKYQRRPNPSYKDFEVIKERVKSASLVDYHVFVGAKTIKYRSSSVDRAFTVAVTYDCGDLFNIEYEKGRYYTPAEYYYGMEKVILGHTVAEKLFGAVDPIGKEVTLMGRKLEVIGVIEKSGKDLLRVLDFDEAILLGFETARKMTNIESNNPFGATINVKAAEGVGLQQLRDELTGVLRAQRKLKPREKDNFALNNISLLANMMDSFFGALNMAGVLIGGFSIFVGMFSVANIMFVSVKERTNIIGIKKALGAKQYFILLEFLIESVILCLVGGLVGLGLVFLVTNMLTAVLPFPIYLSMSNIVTGMVLAAVIGILAGFIPAFQASRLDPVEAIRK